MVLQSLFSIVLLQIRHSILNSTACFTCVCVCVCILKLSAYNHVKKNQLDAQLILSIFR